MMFWNHRLVVVQRTLVVIVVKTKKRSGEKEKSSKSTNFANRLVCIAHALGDCVQCSARQTKTIKSNHQNHKYFSSLEWTNVQHDGGRVYTRVAYEKKKWHRLRLTKMRRKKKWAKHTICVYIPPRISKRVCFVNQFNCCLIINYCSEVFLIRCERFPN